jgi:hypothetical protein
VKVTAKEWATVTATALDWAMATVTDSAKVMETQTGWELAKASERDTRCCHQGLADAKRS